METALGLLGFILFIVAVVAFAAALTWLTVKISPTRDKADKQAAKQA